MNENTNPEPTESLLSLWKKAKICGDGYLDAFTDKSFHEFMEWNLWHLGGRQVIPHGKYKI